MAERKKDNGSLKPKLKRKEYEEELNRLHRELCQLQEWVKHNGLRVIILFEGRDGAGKGGTIKAITERVSPRAFRVLALPAPSDREKNQMYLQRYVQHFPAASEILIFDRSWYNRAGAEYVMGFCTEEQHRRFLELCPLFEKYIVEGGVVLFKFWLKVGSEEQERRFKARIEDPLRQWKLSPVDLPSREKWYEYSRARGLGAGRERKRDGHYRTVDDDARADSRNVARQDLTGLRAHDGRPVRRAHNRGGRLRTSSPGSLMVVHTPPGPLRRWRGSVSA